MTDQELRDLVAELAVAQKQTERQLGESKAETERFLRESKAEGDHRQAELERFLRESKIEADHRQAELERFLRESKTEADRRKIEADHRQAELERFLHESKTEADRRQIEADQRQAETDRQLRETDKRLNELGKQIGGLSDKFGSFTEGMAYPSMRKLLEDRFGLTNFSIRARSRRNGRSIELDALAYSNTDRNVAYVVEIKSHLRPESIEQILKTLRDFPDFFPEHRGKQLYGVLAVVDASDELCAQVLEKGIYLAQISGDTFALRVPEGFVPRSFNDPARAAAAG